MRMSSRSLMVKTVLNESMAVTGAMMRFALGTKAVL